MVVRLKFYILGIWSDKFHISDLGLACQKCHKLNFWSLGPYLYDDTYMMCEHFIRSFKLNILLIITITIIIIIKYTLGLS